MAIAVNWANDVSSARRPRRSRRRSGRTAGSSEVAALVADKGHTEHAAEQRGAGVRGDGFLPVGRRSSSAWFRRTGRFVRHTSAATPRAAPGMSGPNRAYLPERWVAVNGWLASRSTVRLVIAWWAPMISAARAVVAQHVVDSARRDDRQGRREQSIRAVRRFAGRRWWRFELGGHASTRVTRGDRR